VFLLTAAFVLNLLIYGVIVRPLERSVANVEQSTVAAEQALTAAQAEHAKADGTRTGKDRASKELATFYSSVLAQDLAGARRLTYGRVSRMAGQSRLIYRSGKYVPVEDRGSELTKLKATVELTGSYANMRTFIHALKPPRVRGHQQRRVGRGQLATTRCVCLWNCQPTTERPPMSTHAASFAAGSAGRRRECTYVAVRWSDIEGLYCGFGPAKRRAQGDAAFDIRLRHSARSRSLHPRSQSIPLRATRGRAHPSRPSRRPAGYCACGPEGRLPPPPPPIPLRFIGYLQPRGGAARWRC
jgi:hypothetical protein